MKWNTDMSAAPRDGTIVLLHRPPTSFGTWSRCVAASYSQEMESWFWPSDIADEYSFEEYQNCLESGDFYDDDHDNFIGWLPLPEEIKVTSV